MQVLSSNQSDEEKQLKRNSKNMQLIFVDEGANRLRINSGIILDFKILLKDFKFKHLNEVIIENEYIESIEDNDFGEISFDRVYINKCPKLKQIHWDAFGMQSDQIKRFDAWKNYVNLLPNLISETNSDYDLIKLINSLVNCEEIYLNSFYEEMQPIKLRNLEYLTLSGYHSSYKIESICSYAFYECDKIELIDLRWNNISYISENAFHFRNENNKILNIVLYINNLEESSFALNSLYNFKRSTKLNLNGNEIKYLNEEFLKPFFDVNELNEIALDNRYFDFKSKENQWNQCNEKYRQRIPFDLVINNNDLESIEDNDFSDKSYKKIYIQNCSKLQRIHWNAFGIQNDKIEKFFACNELPYLKSIQNSEYDLIKLINSLVNCENIRIKPFHHELQQINLNKSKWLTIDGSDSSIKITVICDNAFYECDNIREVNLSNNNIHYISENVFNFRNENNIISEINLTNDQLDQSCFAIDSLTNLKRSTRLILLENQIKYLKEEVFKPF